MLVFAQKQVTKTSYINFVQNCLLNCQSWCQRHGTETWPVGKENEVALQCTDIWMVKWIYGVKLKDRVPSKGWRDGQG